MHSFNEDLLQFIWRFRLLKPTPLITISGKEIQVIKTGDLNLDSGPDFFNSQVKVDGVLLAGNVEVHIRTSDWLKHFHQEDASYDNIILHVVYEHDQTIDQNTRFNVEVLELKNYISAETLLVYQTLSAAKDKLPCAGQLPKVDDLKFLSWLERMTVERLESKTRLINQLFERYDKDYTQTFYALLLRNFGFKVNAFPFELLGQQLPFNLLLKHADNLEHLECLLLGMAGLLDRQIEEPYIRKLQNEFEYLKIKYKLQPLDAKLFKFSKLRPANFPDLRLAQFAHLVFSNHRIFVSPEITNGYNDLMAVLTIKPQGYWSSHYNIDGADQEEKLAFGRVSAENIIINTFAPFFFYYGKKLGRPALSDLSVELLNQCAAEDNVKTRLYSGKKKMIRNASASQACIQLHDHYCIHKKCLHCGIGAEILKPGSVLQNVSKVF